MIKPIKPSPCNPVLPTEYQEVLSYMEAVEKCANGVNDLIDKTNSIDEQIKSISDDIDSIELKIDEINNDIGKIEQDLTGLDEALTTHEEDKHNPHDVSKEQIGLGNVDNTSDLDKPISTATQTALNNKMPLMSFEQLYYYEVTSGGGLVNFTVDKNGKLFNLKAAYVMISCGESVNDIQIAGHFFFDGSDNINDRIQFTMSNANTDRRGDFFGYKLGNNLWITGFDNFRAKSSSLTKYGIAAHYELPLTDEHFHITKISLSRNDGLPIGTKIKIFGIQDNSNS